jgi:hypothetical protein
MATVFTAGYLTVFNSGLVWIVEYTDLIKVGFVSSLFILIFLAFLELFLNSFFKSMSDDFSKSVMRIMIVILSISLLVIIFLAYRTSNNINSYIDNYIALFIITLVMYASLLFMIIARTKRHFNRNWDVNVGDAARYLMMLMVLAAISGVIFWVISKNNRSLRETIFLDDRVLYNSMVVMLTSTYAVIYTDDRAVLVVPVARVREIQG